LYLVVVKAKKKDMLMSLLPWEDELKDAPQTCSKRCANLIVPVGNVRQCLGFFTTS